jgi:hypothetical protein
MNLKFIKQTVAFFLIFILGMAQKSFASSNSCKDLFAKSENQSFWQSSAIQLYNKTKKKTFLRRLVGNFNQWLNSNEQLSENEGFFWSAVDYAEKVDKKKNRNILTFQRVRANPFEIYLYTKESPFEVIARGGFFPRQSINQEALLPLVYNAKNIPSVIPGFLTDEIIIYDIDWTQEQLPPDLFLDSEKHVNIMSAKKWNQIQNTRISQWGKVSSWNEGKPLREDFPEKMLWVGYQYKIQRASEFTGVEVYIPNSNNRFIIPELRLLPGDELMVRHILISRDIPVQLNRSLQDFYSQRVLNQTVAVFDRTAWREDSNYKIEHIGLWEALYF